MRMWSRNTTLALAALCLAAPAAMSIAPRDAGAESFPYRLTVINRCNRLIYVARRVRDPEGFWITRAWMVIRAGARASRNLRTRNRVFYLYAFSADRRLTWSGRNKRGSVRRPVIQRRFTHTSGPLYGPQMRFVSFAKKTIRQGTVRFTQTFYCANAGGASRGGGSAVGEGEGEGGGQGGGTGGGGTGGGGMGGGGAEGGGRDPGVGDPGGGQGGGSQGGGSQGGGSGGPQLGAIPPALTALKGRKVWVSTKSTPARDYCAMLRRLGMTVRCSYEQHTGRLNTVILRCSDHDAGVADDLKRYLGLTNLPTNNWQRDSGCGRYNEITIYLNQ
jgi:uncharacterized membrane protein